MTKSPTLNNFFEQINQEMASKMVGELFTGFLDQPSPGSSKEPFDLDFLIRVLREMKKSLDGERAVYFSLGFPARERNLRE